MPLEFAENVLKAGFSVPKTDCWDTCFVFFFFRNNGHGSHSEVLWSSVCRCGFKVKGLACQMLYENAEEQPISPSILLQLTPFKGRRTRSGGQGGLSQHHGKTHIRVPSYVRAHSWDALPPFYSARHRATGRLFAKILIDENLDVSA